MILSKDEVQAAKQRIFEFQNILNTFNSNLEKEVERFKQDINKEYNNLLDKFVEKQKKMAEKVLLCDF